MVLPEGIELEGVWGSAQDDVWFVGLHGGVVRWNGVSLESLELAFVAALQHLPAVQRAVLILREVLEFSAGEAAELLDRSVPAVNSALQRAKSAVSTRVPPLSQQATLAQLGDAARQALVQAYVNAWAQQD